MGEQRCERVSELGRTYAAALLMGDEVAAEIAIREAMEAGLSAAEIDDEIIAPALWLVGDLWERGEISVADEHLATEISMRVLTLQREAERLAVSRGAHRVMLATPAGALHVVALRMIGNLLRDAGYDIVMLGPDVPAGDLVASAKRYEPDVICLSTTMPGGSDRVLIAIDEVQRARPQSSFVIGGRGLSSRVRTLDAKTEIASRVGEARARGAGDQRLPARPRGHRGGRRDGQARRHELDLARQALRAVAVDDDVEPGVQRPALRVVAGELVEHPDAHLARLTLGGEHADRGPQPRDRALRDAPPQLFRVRLHACHDMS